MTVYLNLEPSTELKDFVSQIKRNPHYKSKGFKGNFPNPSSLKSKPHQHLNIIIEQAELLIAALDDPSRYTDCLGILPTSVDVNTIAKIFATDILQFSSEYPDLKLLQDSFL